MDLGVLAAVYALIVVAELPGKTTFASFLMASRARPWPVFAGAAVGFVVHTAIAVAAGSLLGRLPARAIQIAVGLLFLGLAIAMWREDVEEAAEQGFSVQTRFSSTAATAFGVIFFAQWGDPTQLATAALAARYSAPGTVFVAATLGLWTVSGLAVLAGHFSKGRIDPRFLNKVSAAVFAAVGAALLAEALLRRR
ncbi:MAG: TMEM165/GDT1 family protein [Elusimicrobiota bacterium]